MYTTRIVKYSLYSEVQRDCWEGEIKNKYGKFMLKVVLVGLQTLHLVSWFLLKTLPETISFRVKGHHPFSTMYLKAEEQEPSCP